MKELDDWGIEPARILILDRDSIFSTDVVRAINNVGTNPMRTAHKAPWQNGTAKRWVGSARHEMLDHAIVLGEDHLRRLLGECVAHYHDDGKQTPGRRVVQPKPSRSMRVVALPRIGGLSHR